MKFSEEALEASERDKTTRIHCINENGSLNGRILELYESKPMDRRCSISCSLVKPHREFFNVIVAWFYYDTATSPASGNDGVHCIGSR